MWLGVRLSCALNDQTGQRTTCDYARVGIEVDDEYLSHMSSNPPYCRSSHDVPQKHGAVAARGHELGVIMRSASVLGFQRMADNIRDIHCHFALASLSCNMRTSG